MKRGRGGLREKRAGFTLIEMLVSILVIGALVGGGIAAYSRIVNKQAVINAGGEFVGVMRDIQKRAQSGQKPVGCREPVPGQVLEAWSMVRVSDSKYMVGAECGEFQQEEVFELAEGIRFVSWPGGDKISFAVLTGEAIVSGEVVLEDDGGDHTYQISVSNAGGVEGVLTN